MASIGDLIDFCSSDVDKSIEELTPFMPPVFMKIVNDLKEKCNSLQRDKMVCEIQTQNLLMRFELLNQSYFRLEDERKDLIREKNHLHATISVLEDKKKSLKKALRKILVIAEREDSDVEVAEDPSHEVCDSSSITKNLPRTMHEFLGMRVESLGLKFIHFLQIFGISKGTVATGSVITQTLLGEMWMDTECIDLIAMNGFAIAKFLEKLGYTYMTVECSYLQNVTQYICFCAKDDRTFKVSIIVPDTTSLASSHSSGRSYTTHELEAIPAEIAQLAELDCCRNYFDGVRFKTAALGAINCRTYSSFPGGACTVIGPSFTLPRNDDRIRSLVRKYESRGFTRSRPSTSSASFHASVPTLNRK